MNVLGTAPQIAAGYNIAPMFSYMMKQQGADLTPFEKSPEQLQYEQALSVWQQSAAMLADKKDMTPEQIQEALGPMPQPPQTVQQQAAQRAENPTASTGEVAAAAPFARAA